MTRPRRAILAYLANTTVHPSARQVFEAVRKKHPGMSLATVYNTLGILVRMGLIKVMEFEALDNRYETNLSPHINLFCTICGKIQDLEEAFPTSPEKVKEKIGFQILDYRLEYYGICQVCRAVLEKEDQGGRAGS